jgi:4-amino-4-deoxy-L-arabinose transferase-like glycosyltransferase
MLSPNKAEALTAPSKPNLSEQFEALLWNPPWTLISYVILGLVALLPRVWGLGNFALEDETRHWIERSTTFLAALQRGDFAATALSNHPGVTTMWLGSMGNLLHRLLLTWGLIKTDAFPTTFALMQFPIALTNTIGLLVGYWLLRRLLPINVAILAAFLWATDPFLIGLSRILHVDGLATTFSTLCLLSSFYYWHHKPQSSWLILSGVAGGLALLSKSTTLLIFPILAFTALAATKRQPGPLSRFLNLWSPLLVWSFSLVATIFLVWPAAWANPGEAYRLVSLGVAEGQTPHIPGNFFMGQAVEVPDWRFYPIALVLRLTPWTLLGLLLLFWAWPRSETLAKSRHDLALMAGLAICYVVGLSCFEKQLNRYLGLAFPVLDILAAAGLVWGAEHFGLLLGRENRSLGYSIANWVLNLIILAGLGNLLWWQPYYTLAFNQILGGLPTGINTFSVGSGEGLEQAATWLNTQPNLTSVTVAATMPDPLQPYLRDGAQASSGQGNLLPTKTGYVVLYLRSNDQGRPWNPPFNQFNGQDPVHTVTIQDIPFASIYQVPAPAVFGEGVKLHSYAVNTSAFRTTGIFSLTTHWQPLKPIVEDYKMFIHVFNPTWELVAQANLPPGGPNAPTSTWKPSRFVSWEHSIPISTTIPPGNYWVTLGLYRPQDLWRLPLHTPARPDSPPDGGNIQALEPVYFP